ncbi:MAG TPA: hypothetical protein VIF64_12840, partial [Pyrinomonadaceae bacterium]
MAEMPENGDSSDSQAKFVADPSGIAHFPEVAVAAAAGLDRPAETSATMSVMAVAVAAMPETGESREMQVEPGSDSSGIALFEADFDQDLDDAFASLVSQEASPEAQSVSE